MVEAVFLFERKKLSPRHLARCAAPRQPDRGQLDRQPWPEPLPSDVEELRRSNGICSRRTKRKDVVLRMGTEAMPSGEPKPAPSQQSKARASKPKAPASGPQAQAAPRLKRPSLKLLIGGMVALMVMIVGIPRILRSLNTVSTDDAYVNSHVTFVAPRVSGQVMQVLVDDNSRVRKGDVLVELDPEPFRVQVAIRQSAVDVAKANLVMAEATVRGLIAQARSQRFKLTHAIEDVDNQVALIRQRVATWEQSKASLVLAQQSLTAQSICSRARL